MKSKAKRNNNRPASFREKCRNAFAGALKGLANINAAEKENVAASFDLDKRSVERRIDAMEKNRAMAKRIADGCIKSDPSFNFDDEWIAINILMDPPYNVGEEMFCYSLAAAIWILDAIRANQKMDEALALLPKDKDKLDSVRLPKCVSPCYSEAVLRSMVYTILHRNEDCVGLIKSPKDPARVFVTDGYTIAGKQHQDVPSRRVFEGILALLPEDMVDNAVNTFAFMSKAALSRYFTCRNKWIKKEIKFTQELRKKTEELKVISQESVNLVEKAKAVVNGTSVPKRIEGVPLIQSGVTYFGVGGALGFDTMMADLLLELKKENSRMRIIEVLPYEGYRAKWTPEQQLHAKNLDRQMDKIVYVSKEPSRGAYLARGRHLVDGSRYCISYCNKPTGGTAFTVKYALERGLTVYNASSFDVNTLLGHKTLGNS